MKILLAVDGSEASLAAVEEAARTPWPEGSVVRIVSVADIPFPDSAVGGAYAERLLRRMGAERIFDVYHTSDGAIRRDRRRESR